MKSNFVIQTILDHKSIRKYSEKDPPFEVIKTIVKAGQQAPFATQCYSVLLSRNRMKHPYRAPLQFTICIDAWKFELIMSQRNWKFTMNNLSFLLLGIQDAALMAENMVIAGRSLGLGSCFIGNATYRAEQIAKECKLPKRVFPLVQLVMGYPAENPPPRPRYPIEFTMFEDEYPTFTREEVLNAMEKMDKGYLAQNYYKTLNAKIPLLGDREETFTFDDYSWTEHISRKLGQWDPEPDGMLNKLKERGFQIISKRKT